MLRDRLVDQLSNRYVHYTSTDAQDQAAKAERHSVSHHRDSRRRYCHQLSNNDSATSTQWQQSSTAKTSNRETHHTGSTDNRIVKDSFTFVPTEFGFKNCRRVRVSRESEWTLPTSQPPTGCISNTVPNVYLQFVLGLGFFTIWILTFELG